MSLPSLEGDTTGRGVEASLGATIPISSLAGPLAIPKVVGRYEVEEVIGEGAMGVVLRARDPKLDRVVAIKLLRGHGSSDALSETARRLRREAQALARLSHPNVVEVYDVGVIDAQVFVAMEHVAGCTLGEWLGQRRPSRAEVLEAFEQAGRGLAAAHAAGLVHRDFKPANVLRGDDGRVRVVDFGLAVPPGESEVGPTLGSLDGSGVDLRLTATGMVMGTPAYMSPEAWRGAQVDARGDQFGFCVALFEALYGVRPFRGADPRELASKTLRGEITVPDESGGSGGSAVPAVPAWLRDVMLRGLSPSPDARWPSMDALLERLRPRRRGRRGWWIAGAGLCLGLVAGVGLWVQAPPEAGCDHAEQAVTELWNDAVRTRMHESFGATALPYAEQAWGRASEALDAQASALAEARRGVCEEARAGTVPADVLDRRAACLGQRLSELRGVVAVLERAEAASVRNASSVIGGLRGLEACADEVLAAAVPPAPAEVAAEVDRARDDLARVMAMRRAGDYDGARTLVQQVIERVQGLGYAPLLAEARLSHGNVLQEVGEYEEAARELEDVAMLAQTAGHDAVAAEASTQLVFMVGNRLRRFEEAERWVRHAQAAVERLPEASEAEDFLEGTLAARHWAMGELPQARERYERAIGAREQRLGPRHPITLLMRSNLAMVLHELGDNTRARALLERVLADRIEVLGLTHPEIASTYGNLAVLEQVMGELDASVEHGEHALAILADTLGTEHPNYAQLQVNLSNTEYLRGNVTRAIELQEQAKASLERSLGPRDLIVGRSFSNLGALYNETERFDEARLALRRAREIYEERLPPGHPELAGPIENLARVDLAQGRLEEALTGFDEALVRLEAAWGKEHPELVGALHGRADAYRELGRVDDTVAELRRALEILAGDEGPPGRRAALRSSLADTLWAKGEHEEALGEAEAARTLVADDGVDAQLREKIDAWLAEHR